VGLLGPSGSLETFCGMWTSARRHSSRQLRAKRRSLKLWEIIRLIPVSITVLRGWAGEAVISAARLVVNLYRTQIVTAAASLATARAIFEVSAPVTLGCATTCLTFWRRLQQRHRDNWCTAVAFDDSTVWCLFC